MSYQDVSAGLVACFGRALPDIAVNLDYEPTAAQDSPLIYSHLDSFTRSRGGGTLTRVEWRTLHRLCIRWQDPEEAERALRDYANAIPAAVEADPWFGRLMRHGEAVIGSGDAGWTNIGGTEYRTLDFFSTVVEIYGYQSGT